VPGKFKLNNLLSAMLGAAALAGAPSHAVNINNPYLDQNFGGILGDYYDSADTMPNVVAIFIKTKDGTMASNCTGSLINSRTILTAAHCVVGDDGEMEPGIDAWEIRFSPDPNTVISTHNRKVRDIVYHENYLSDPDSDIAIITLDRAVHGVEPVQLAPAGYTISLGSLATIVGYGLAGTGMNPGRTDDDDPPQLPGYDDSRRRIAVTQIGDISEKLIQGQFRLPGDPDGYNKFNVPGPVPDMQGQPEGGDSGGPLFVQTPSGWLQIGTVIRGDGGLYGDSGYASIDVWTWVPFYAGWLQANIDKLLASKTVTTEPGKSVERWSDGTAWDGGAPPKNVDGRVDPVDGDWELGTYYDVVVDDPVHLIVDEDVDIDSLTVGHDRALVEVERGRLLYTAFDTSILAGELQVDGVLDADSLWLEGGRLSGTGTLALETGLTQTGGVLAPGHSPGTLTINGKVDLGPGARYEVEIDGAGTGSGAGSHDRLVVSGAYSANGAIAPILRDIPGSATNRYSPPIGQGFEVVSAAGGVRGSYTTLVQPAAGLLPGTRFDTVYGANSIMLYATPAHYSNLEAAGVDDNRNRRDFGAALDASRPAAGVRAADGRIKSLYDRLAVQTAGSLPRAMDQMGGVGYAQLIQTSFENSKFLASQTDQALAAQRRGDPLPPIASRAGAAAPAHGDKESGADPDKVVWGTAMGRISSQKADGEGYKVTSSLGGLIGGVQKRLESGVVAGYSLAYAYSNPDVDQDMGHGYTNNVQATIYAGKSFDSGYFVQGTAGVGAGRIKASRYVPLTQTGHSTSVNTMNATVSGLAGWASGKADQPRVELTLGLRYMGQRYKGFGDSNGQAASALEVARGTQHSFTTALGAAASMPFTAGSVDWRASAWADLSHEFADTHATIEARLLGAAYNQRSGAIGRDKVSSGLALSGKVSQRTTINLSVGGEAAKNWKAASAAVGVQVAF